LFEPHQIPNRLANQQIDKEVLEVFTMDSFQLGTAAPAGGINAATTHHVNEKLSAETVKDAARADAVEHNQTIRQALVTHKKAMYVFRGGNHIRLLE
jgi:hypothetical protein